MSFSHSALQSQKAVSYFSSEQVLTFDFSQQYYSPDCDILCKMPRNMWFSKQIRLGLSHWAHEIATTLNQNAVTALFSSKQLLTFGCARQRLHRILCCAVGYSP